MATIEERVHDLVAPLLSDLELELIDIEHAPPILRVTVDRDGGVDLDAIAKATRAVSRAIDEHDPIDSRFTLEVSSPGIERPLRTPEHFVRAVGATVSVKTLPGVEGDRRIAGVLIAADDDGVTVRTDDGAERRVRHDEIERARTTFSWGPPPKPGKRPADKRKAS